MIRVSVETKGVRVTGHASDYHKPGGNVVCAAVSALTCNLINCLRVLSEDTVKVSMASGNVSISWEKLSDKGKLLVDSWYQGILAIEQEYKCITIC